MSGDMAQQVLDDIIDHWGEDWPEEGYYTPPRRQRPRNYVIGILEDTMTTAAYAAPQILEIEMHNSGSKMRKRCKWRWSLQEIGRWQPRKRAQALWLGSAIDRALKAYYHLRSRKYRYDLFNSGNYPDGTNLSIPWDDAEPFWDEDACRQAGWEALEAYLSSVEQFDDTVKAAGDALAKLAREMWIMYLCQLDREPDNFEVIEMDRQFKGFLGNSPMLPGLTAPVPFYYAGEFDGVVLVTMEDGSKAIYIFENKTSSQVDVLIDSLDRDEQSSRYQMAVTRMIRAGAFLHLGIAIDTPVMGTIFNILLKKIPGEVQVNAPKSRANPERLLSKVLHNSRVEDYVDALKEHRPYEWAEKRTAGATRLEPIDTTVGTLSPWLPKTMDTTTREALVAEWNEQHLPALSKLNAIKWHQHVEVYRNDAMIEMVSAQLYAECVEETELRLDPSKIYRNPSFTCKIDCPLLEPCTANLRGQPIQAMLEEFFYVKGGPDDPYVNSQGQSVLSIEDVALEEDYDALDDLPF